MLGYNFESSTKKLKENMVEDALSRKDHDFEELICIISII